MAGIWRLSTKLPLHTAGGGRWSWINLSQLVHGAAVALIPRRKRYIHICCWVIMDHIKRSVSDRFQSLSKNSG